MMRFPIPYGEVVNLYETRFPHGFRTFYVKRGKIKFLKIISIYIMYLFS